VNRSVRKLLISNLSLWVGVLMAVVLLGIAFLGPYFGIQDPLKVTSDRHADISKAHPLGTDFFGRDVLARMIFGARYSLTIGVASSGLSMLLGSLFGLLAGYYPNRKFARLIIWMTDTIMAFPILILGAMVAMVFGTGIFNTIIALAIAFFPRFIRLARGVTLATKEEVYITAARSIGMSDWRLLRTHVVPNILSPIIVMGVLWTSDAISLEVSLSFLGLGVPPPTPSWGTILQDNLKFIMLKPLLVIWPCVAVAWTVLSLNLIGDRFRDILDPKMR